MELNVVSGHQYASNSGCTKVSFSSPSFFFFFLFLPFWERVSSSEDWSWILGNPPCISLAYGGTIEVIHHAAYNSFSFLSWIYMWGPCPESSTIFFEAELIFQVVGLFLVFWDFVFQGWNSRSIATLFGIHVSLGDAKITHVLFLRGKCRNAEPSSTPTILSSSLNQFFHYYLPPLLSCDLFGSCYTFTLSNPFPASHVCILFQSSNKTPSWNLPEAVSAGRVAFVQASVSWILACTSVTHAHQPLQPRRSPSTVPVPPRYIPGTQCHTKKHSVECIPTLYFSFVINQSAFISPFFRHITFRSSI